ncbi:MAG TPA: YsnF/AvaK domain-containing protein, partial [Acidobacteriaceae bacterium]|nr:YsnF/AvaK domain-containing protein [Acidobacteriaceae bacterium]
VLRVHRDRIQRGEARLRKETVTENQRVDVPVTREELVVEKVPVAGEKAAPGARIGEDSEVRVPLSEERVSVDKEPVVREEVRVGKKGVTNVESRDETLRREELRVEDKSKKAS